MVYPKSNTRAWVAYVDDVPGSMDTEGTSYASCAVGVQAEMQVASCGDQLVHTLVSRLASRLTPTAYIERGFRRVPPPPPGAQPLLPYQRIYQINTLDCTYLTLHGKFGLFQSQHFAVRP